MKSSATSATPRVSASALGLALWLLAGPAGAANDFSAAEQALFLGTPLSTMRPPQTLDYSFRKAGSLEAPFDDTVKLDLKAAADGRCCAVTPRFFSGERAMKQPEVDNAQGNPAVMYFLERDIREMQRLTGGQPNYFRKRIRMAVYHGATARELKLPYRGATVAVKEYAIAPYLDDPNRVRFQKLAGKRYNFYLSDAVPGGLYAIRTRIDGADDKAPPLMQEEMLLQGAESPPPAPKP
ncbi:hypothetical protein [Variovorax sp. OV329]|uniref:hypothetical protein n=1 Tax=Variovorax sp. OV329 TaxID=1882825 RepID=UPI0008E31E23|nr:hypothetical protein [Variovorax sp. OV329]SFL95947.1 hypothetical protein SAMN05444747_101464 [Variovorax sp. OV329]